MPIFLLFLSFIMTSQDSSGKTPAQRLLPASVGCWSADGMIRSYSEEEIFDYMDGAGEIYRCYDFKDLSVQRYICPNRQDILVEIFDMGSPRNSFGIYTYMSGRGKNVGIGEDGEYKSGLLCFWKHKYFVCVQIERETDSAEAVILDMGRYIAHAIREEGGRPDIFRYIPENKYKTEGVRYFFRYEILNIHYYVSDEDVLHINDRTEGLLAKSNSGSDYLLLIKYDDEAHTDAAYHSFLIRHMQDTTGGGVVKTGNKKWASCAKIKNYLIIILDAPTKEQALISLMTIKRRLP